MSRIRGKDTKLELLLRKALWANGLRYRLKNSLPGRPDIVFPRRRLVIFVDGCFWHGCSAHCQIPEKNRIFWEKKLSRNMERDKEVGHLIELEGWEVLRFWEHTIKNDLSGCVARVVQAVHATGC
jgi:DNA mismatch endonuclease (patch repair protein)